MLASKLKLLPLLSFQQVVLQIYQLFMPNGSSIAWLKVIALGTILLTSKKMYISFKNCKVIVFWTKNPKPILPYLHILDEMRIHYYFQVTLNDYVNERFEPNVASVEERVETFRQLSQMIGKERVIWRFDPLIITLSISPRELLKRIWNVGNKLKGYTDKLVFSFIDVKSISKSSK